MSGPDTFFASDALVDLFTDPPVGSQQITAEVNGVKCLFVSYSSDLRLLKVNMNNHYNPFDIFESSSVNVSIIFPKGVSKTLEYVDCIFKIEQSQNSWLVTIGDKDEQ